MPMNQIATLKDDWDYSVWYETFLSLTKVLISLVFTNYVMVLLDLNSKLIQDLMIKLAFGIDLFPLHSFY